MNPILNFKPLPWQSKFLNSEAKSPWAIGGNRSGKTEIGAYKMASFLVGFCPQTGRKFPPGKAWASALDFPLAQILLDKMRFYLEGSCKYKYHKGEKYFEVERENGATSRCWLKSCDSGREKYQGQDLDLLWFDEEPPFDIFKEGWARTIDRAGQVYGTMTPVKGTAWLHQRIYSNHDDPNFDVVCMAMTDNTHLQKTEIDSFSSLVDDDDEIAIRVKGEYRLVAGRPVLNIGRLTHLRESHITAPRFRGHILETAQ